MRSLSSTGDGLLSPIRECSSSDTDLFNRVNQAHILHHRLFHCFPAPHLISYAFLTITLCWKKSVLHKSCSQRTCILAFYASFQLATFFFMPLSILLIYRAHVRSFNCCNILFVLLLLIMPTSLFVCIEVQQKSAVQDVTLSTCKRD